MPATELTPTLPKGPNCWGFKSFREYADSYSAVCQTLAERMPEIKSSYLIKGSGPISTQHLRHRLSWDLDLTTAEEMANPTPLFRKLKKIYGRRCSMTGDESVGIFQGTLALDGLPPINIDLMTAVEQIPARYVERNSDLGKIPFVGLNGYSWMKALSIADREDPKDAYDLAACYNSPLASGAAVEQIRRRLRVLDVGKLANMSRAITPDEFKTGLPGFKHLEAPALSAFAGYAEQRFQQVKSIDEKRQEMRRLERIDRCFGISM